MGSILTILENPNKMFILAPKYRSKQISKRNSRRLGSQFTLILDLFLAQVQLLNSIDIFKGKGVVFEDRLSPLGCFYFIRRPQKLLVLGSGILKFIKIIFWIGFVGYSWRNRVIRGHKKSSDNAQSDLSVLKWVAVAAAIAATCKQLERASWIKSDLHYLQFSTLI